MLPLQFFIGMIACAINERQQKALEYKTEEVLVLKDILKAVSGSGDPMSAAPSPGSTAMRRTQYKCHPSSSLENLPWLDSVEIPA